MYWERRVDMEQGNVKFRELWKAFGELPKTFRLLARVDKGCFLGLLGFSVLVGILPILTLYLSQEFINSLVLHESFRMTGILFGIYIVANFIAEAIGQLQAYVQSRYQYLLQYRLHYFVLDECTKMSLRDFETAEMYDRIEKITGEIAYRPYQMLLSLIGMITAVITMLSSVCYLFFWQPLAALILLIVPVLSMFYYLRIGRSEFKMTWNRAKEERKVWYLSHLLTRDFSFKEISVLGIRDYLLEKYRKVSEGFLKQNQQILNWKTLFQMVYEVIVQGIGFCIIGFALFAAYTGKILVGNVISYIRSIGLIQSNSQQFMQNLYGIYSCSLYMDLLFSFLEYSRGQQTEEGEEKIGKIQDVVVKNLSFSYPNGGKLLKNVNLSFHRGETVALVGPNGSGKSTMLKLLAGLYEADEGEILINGTPLKQIDRNSYHAQLSVLFQDFVKYEMTMQENIGFGSIEKMQDTERMKQILDRLHLQALKKEDQTYALDMQLGNWFENGRQLSQGQWQKIALARTYFKEASFYILDEPNAALDTVSEREVFQSFFELSRGKIGVYISHRLNAAQMADKIIVMKDGEIVAVGKHEKLLATCEVYRELYQAENYDRESMGYAG